MDPFDRPAPQVHAQPVFPAIRSRESRRDSRSFTRVRDGFTLIELVIVLVVLAVAGVMTTPALQRTLESVRAEAATRRTAAFLDDTRRHAVLERKVLVLRCRPRPGRLEVVGAADGDRTFRVPEQVALVSCRPEEVRYHPQGSSTGMTLLLRDKGGREHRLSVGAFTGLARIDAGQ